MNRLEEFREAGITINWRTLLVGWDGPGKYCSVLTMDDIREFAVERLAEADTAPAVTKIAVADDDESADVRAQLLILSAEEGSDLNGEIRKWQLVLLKRLLSALPEDPLYGLLALTEFWERFDFPADGPHILQRPGEADYFTRQNYEYVIARHKAWLAQQLAAQRR